MIKELKTQFRESESREKIVSAWSRLCPDHWSNDEVVTFMASAPRFTVLRINTLQASQTHIIEELQKELNARYLNRKYLSPKILLHESLKDVIVLISQRCDEEKPCPEGRAVIVDVACGEAVLRGAHVFAPGVMSLDRRVAVGDTVSVYADVYGQCLRGLTKAFTGTTVFVGNGTALMDRTQLFTVEKPQGIAVRMDNPLVDCPPLKTLLPSFIFTQNLPSIVVSHILNPLPGESIIDLCAAPGGKATHIALLMKNKGTVICLDKCKRKICEIEKSAKLLGIDIIKAFCWNSTKVVSSSHQDGSPPFSPESFDRVLVDVPCSGLGQRPSLYFSTRLKELKSFPPLQRHICKEAVKLLRPGGILVYSTCTILPEENEQQVSWLLNTYPDLSLVFPSVSLGTPGLAGEGLNDEQRCKVRRFGAPSEEPNWNTDTIGFFIAKFVKNIGKFYLN